METNGKKYYIIGFSLLVVIIGVVFVWLFNGFNRTEAKVEASQLQVDEIKACISDMKADIGSIKTNIDWIKGILSQKMNTK